MPELRTERMKRALMRSNTRLLLSAVMLFQALAMLLIAFQKETVNVQAECDASNIAGKLVAASQEIVKGITFGQTGIEGDSHCNEEHA